MSIDKYIEKFEKEIKDSVSFRFRHTPESHKEILLRGHTINRLDINEFVNHFRRQTKYPNNRLDSLVHKLIDIKLQTYLIEVDLGANNDLMGLIDREEENDRKKAHIQFLSASFDQSLIFKSRILWERVMNFVYYLETGRKLKAKKGFNKKATFFEFIADTKWRFLCDYKEYIEWFDKEWRNPETHDESHLRQRMLSGTMDNDEVNRILGLTGIVSNVFYVNLISIIDGNQPSYRFWTYGMSENKMLN